jgi:hypothetical protein
VYLNLGDSTAKVAPSHAAVQSNLLGLHCDSAAGGLSLPSCVAVVVSKF